jgi:hypothetical protein
MRSLLPYILLIWSLFMIREVNGQCTNYAISVSGGGFPWEVSWELYDATFNLVAAGIAPQNLTLCLPDGNYFLDMYDLWGDGWNGATMTITCEGGATVYSGLTLISGAYGFYSLNLSGSLCAPVSCPPGTTPYVLEITSGAWPTEVGWDLTINGMPVAGGGAPSSTNLCLTNGCYDLYLYDSFGDGWNGAVYNLYSGGSLVQTGTLSFGYSGEAVISVGGADCGNSGPVTASDCVDAVNVCEDLNFSIDPNGYGLINEIPASGSISNPSFTWGDGVTSPWGSDNYGCLLSGETNSTWMIVNIWEGGSLEFTFGGLGMQVGFYDWIMFPYDHNTCQDIYNNVLPPVRCNWNFSSFGGTGLASTPPPGGDPGNFEPPLNVNTGDQYLIVFSNWSSVSTVVPLQFSGTAIVSCQQLILATDLISFGGIGTPRGNELTWITASESHTEKYIIQRSKDGLTQWDQVSEVPAAGFSAENKSYHSLDTKPHAGQNYYRLMELDDSGVLRKVGECSVQSASGQSLTWPNPSQGFTFFAPAWLAKESVIIRDVTGRETAFTSAQDCTECPVAFELTGTTPGVYFLTVLSNGDTHRLVISGK